MSVRDTITKLLAKANDNAATEDEVHEALAMAAKLSDKYAIDIATLAAQAAGHKPTMVRRKICVNQRSGDFWHKFILDLLAVIYPVKAYMSPSWYNGKRATEYYAAGPDDIIDAAYDTFHFVTAQIEQLYKSNLPSGMSQSERSTWRKNFKYGCASRVHEMASQRRQLITTDDGAAVSETGSTALVVAESFDTLVSEALAFLEDEYGVDLRPVRRTSRRIGAGFSEGRKSGNKVHLTRSLG